MVALVLGGVPPRFGESSDTGNIHTAACVLVHLPCGLNSGVDRPTCQRNAFGNCAPAQGGAANLPFRLTISKRSQTCTAMRRTWKPKQRSSKPRLSRPLPRMRSLKSPVSGPKLLLPSNRNQTLSRAALDDKARGQRRLLSVKAALVRTRYD